MKARFSRLLFGILFLILLTQSASAFFDPTLGRFISRDPIAESGGINLVAFVNNNSITKIDPMGLDGDAGSQAAAGGIAAGLDAGEGAEALGIEADAVTVVNEVELEDDVVGAVADSDADVNVLNAAQNVINNLKNVTVSIGRLRNTAAAAAAGKGIIKVADDVWTDDVNAEIMQGLINQGNTFNLESSITMENFWRANGEMSTFGRELFQLFDAGYTKVGSSMIPP